MDVDSGGAADSDDDYTPAGGGAAAAAAAPRRSRRATAANPLGVTQGGAMRFQDLPTRTPRRSPTATPGNFLDRRGTSFLP